MDHDRLRQCRSPVGFLSAHWRDGRGGAFRMGLEHGAYCLGCCWFLMALLFFGGVMNQLVAGSAAVLVQSEMQAFAAGSFVYLVSPIAGTSTAAK